MSPTELIAIAGPTASGKSGLALRLAEKFPLEIISGDSMQFYRGLNIGVAKPSAEERRRVPHHLIDICDFSERVDVYKFIEFAEAAIADIASRGRIPCVVGGTGFYLKSLLYGLDDLPADRGLRARLDLLYDHPEGFEELKKLMAFRDPAALARWHSHRRKLIRSLEVLELTGKSIAVLQKGGGELRRPAKVFVLDWERGELKRRIAARTADMLDSGWIEEAAKAIAAGLLESPTAHQALGYDLIGEYLAGKLNRDALEALIVTRTWQFARRQLTWFRHQHPEAEWIAMPDGEKELSADLQSVFPGV